MLLTAPTGAAAFVISGMTLHSALLLGTSKFGGFQPLNHDRLNSVRCKLSHLAFLIIDEVSMVGSNMLLQVYKRLQQIKGVLPGNTFADEYIGCRGSTPVIARVSIPSVHCC